MRGRRLRTLLALSAVAAALTALPAAADTASGGPNQLVSSYSTADGSWLVRSGTEVATFGGDTWTSANIARAMSVDCTGCHATAVAVQVVLATGNPSYAAPANAAVAVNASCTGCGSYAYAWQYALTVDRAVHLSPAGQRLVADLRLRIAEAAGSELPSDGVTDPDLVRNRALDLKLDALTAELKSVIDSELDAAGVAASGTISREVQRTPGF
jgi:hypothetical protein